MKTVRDFLLLVEDGFGPIRDVGGGGGGVRGTAVAVATTALGHKENKGAPAVR